MALLDFGDLYPTLVGWTTEPAEAGREEVDGTQTVKITGTLDPAKALGDLGPRAGRLGDITAAQARAGAAARAPSSSGSAPRTCCRGGCTGAQRDRQGVAEGVGPIDLDLTADFSDWGQPVGHPRPQNARPLDPNGLGGLIG